MDNNEEKNTNFQEIKDVNPFEEQLREINEWQNNATNPGYFVGKSNAPLPIRNLSKTPVLMIIVGILFALPTVIFLIQDFTLSNIFSSSVMIIISVAFIVGGVQRLKRKGSH